MKLILTEEQIKNIIEESIFYEGGKKTKSNKGIENTKADVEKYMQQLAKDGTRFQDTAREIGLNPDGYEKGNKSYNKQYQKGFNDEVSKNMKNVYDPTAKSLTTSVNPEMSQEILNAAERLKEYVNQNRYGATINWEDFKQDPDYVYLWRMKDLMDRKGLTYLYDENAPLPSDAGYGIKQGDISNFDYTGAIIKKGKVNKNYNSIVDFWTSRVKNFVESKFGFEVAIPGTVFNSGNNKLPNNTLIVNFTSALRCPAWNECVVKHACYARALEKPHTNVASANTNRYLLWELTRGDEKMLGLMMNMVKAYMFNYENIFAQASSILRKRGIKKINDLINLDLSDELITGELANFFNKNKMVENVRLNENGDFIGQWLVDAWNELGGKVRPFGITISAYTCRNLNFKGVKNIVLNSSNLANKDVDRYFIAISEEAYESFDDTHEGFEKREDGSTRLKTVLKPLGDFDEQGNWVPNGNMYYKCPCGNENIMGAKKTKKEKKFLSDYDCYKCNTCYMPNDMNNGKPYYVFVKVHGASEKYLVERDGGSFRFGFSEHYKDNMQALPNKENTTKKEKMNEETENYNPSSDLALNQVANNMVTSMNNHFASFGTTLEEEKIKDNFKQLLERINKTEF